MTIEEIALGTIFPKEQINAIMELVAITPNPRVALDTLLGIYEEPELPLISILNKKECTLIRYNKWEEAVEHSYTRNKTKYIYISKDTDKALVNETNYTEYQKPYSADVVQILINLNEMETVNSNTSVEQWQKGSKDVYAMST